ASTPMLASRGTSSGRSGAKRSTSRQMTAAAVRMISGAKAWKSMLGFIASYLATEDLGDRSHGGIGQREEGVGVDAEQHDEHEERRPRDPLGQVHVVDVRVLELGTHLA